VSNDPVNFVDPYGLFFSWVGYVGAIAGAVGGMTALAGSGVGLALFGIGVGLTIYDWYDSAQTAKEQGEKLGEHFKDLIDMDKRMQKACE
jgi:hypothetical protein